MNTLPAPPDAASPALRPSRLTELDALRVIAFGLLILYHVGMYYVTWDFHVKSPHPVRALEDWMVWLNPWRMSLLFVISGAATGLMAERGPKGLIGTRSKRLLLPLLFGMAVIVPPQPYLEVVEKLGWTGSYPEFLGLYFQGYHGFCRGDDCLTLPTWNHLWFLPYVWAYSVAALLLMRAGRWQVHALWSRMTRGSRLLWAPWLLFALMRQYLLAPTTHDFVHDGYNHALSAAMFLLGLALFGHRDDRHGAWAAAARWRWWALGLSVGAIALFQHLQAGYVDGEIPDADLMALRALSAARQWLPIVAALGWGRVLLAGRDGPTLRWLSRAVFPCYLLHQTVIVIVAHDLAPRGWPQALEAATVIAITTLACLVFAWLAMRVRWLHPLVGIGPDTARHPHRTVVIPFATGKSA